MQKALNFATPPPAFPISTPKAILIRTLSASPCKPFPRLKAGSMPHDASTADYSSPSSVFPAEACETVGGDACDVEMYPEARLKPEAKSSTAGATTELIDREYLDYDSPKTVFLEEACDDLGGEFWDPKYERQV